MDSVKKCCPINQVLDIHNKKCTEVENSQLPSVLRTSINFPLLDVHGEIPSSPIPLEGTSTQISSCRVENLLFYTQLGSFSAIIERPTGSGYVNIPRSFPVLMASPGVLRLCTYKLCIRTQHEMCILSKFCIKTSFQKS